MENYSVVRNCNVPCCHGQHYIKFNENGIVAIPIWDLKLKNVGKKNIENICGIVCEKDSLCYAHKKLRIFKYFTEEIRERNLNKNIVASKIYIKDNCKHPYFLNSWCFVI